MTDDPRSERVYELFDAAVDLPREQRDRFLDDACAGDDELRRRIAALIESDEQTRSAFLDGVPADHFAKEPPDGRCPVESLVPGATVAGQFRIVRLIGQGGMGQVFEAQQLEPPRRVALKVIATARLSPQTIARFRRETLALARLHHPGIAMIFESGVIRSVPFDGDASGGERPFYVMEFVDGVPLIEFADRGGLPLRDRLALIADIADAVQHAHDQGVVHRDLKPANILVQADGRPKILDFGIARVLPTGPGLDGFEPHTVTFQTDAGQLLGTLPYMSPEQVSGESSRINSQSDVYALGVMLYELLTGRLPFDVRGKSVPEAARIIRDEDPTPLTSMDQQFRALRGDVQTIVLKAIEKDQSRRYGSAAELAADLRRYLRDEPIAARPPSAMYRMRKFARRNKALVGGVVGIIVALCAGLAATSVFAILAGRSAELARKSEEAAIEQRQAAQRQAYRAVLAAAVAALENHDVAMARVHLEAAPEAMRGWEWRHLVSRLDESIAAFRAPDDTIRAWFHPVSGNVLTAGGMDDLLVHEWSVQAGEQTIVREIGFHDSYPHGSFATGAHGAGDVFALLGNAGATVEVLHLGTGGRRSRAIDDPPRPWPHWRVAVDETGTFVAITFEMFGEGGGTPVWGIDLESGDVWRSRPTRGTWNGQLAIGSANVRSHAGAHSMPRIGIATAEHDVAELHDPSNDSVIELVGHSGGVTSIQFNREGNRVATAGRDNTVRLWEAATGEMLAVGRGHRNAITTVSFSPAGNRLATGADDHTIRIWDFTDAAVDLKPIAVLHGHEAPVRSVAFSADGNVLVSLSSDHMVRLWDVSGGIERFVLRGHTSYVYPVAVSPDGSIAASGSWDRTIHLWSLAPHTPENEPLLAILHGHTGYVEKLAFSGDGRWLVSYGAASDRSLRVWSVQEQREVARLERPQCHQLAFHPDNERVFIEWVHHPHEDRIAAARYWNPFTGEIVDEPLPARHHPGPAGATMVTQRGDLAIEVTSEEGRLQARVFDARTGMVLSKFPIGGYLETAGSVLWLSEDPPRLLMLDAPTGSTLIVREPRTGEELASFRGHTGNIFGVTVSPDRSRLVSVGRDQLIHVWDANGVLRAAGTVAGVEQLVQLRGHSSYIWSAAFTPDGSTLITGSGDQSIRLWRTSNVERWTQQAGP